MSLHIINSNETSLKLFWIVFNNCTEMFIRVRFWSVDPWRWTRFVGTSHISSGSRNQNRRSVNSEDFCYQGVWNDFEMMKIYYRYPVL